MSESANEQTALQATSSPDVFHAYAVEGLRSQFGAIVDQVIEALKAGAADLPAVIAALKAAGVAVPSWIGPLVAILEVIFPVPSK